MFTVPTTIVLGAGASCGYGFPTGYGLINDLITVCGQWKHNGTQRNLQKQAGELEELLSSLDPLSIDSFLDHFKYDPLIIECAKKAITQVLLEKSRKAEFHYHQNPGKDFVPFHWYRYLWSAIVSGVKREDLVNKDKPFDFNIVTFNYDPSLEYFLYSRASFMFKGDELSSFLAKIRSQIHHVYGCIMDYEWCREDSKKDPSNDNYTHPDRNDLFGNNLNNDQLSQLVKKNFNNILLIGDRDEKDCEEIQKAIRNAGQLIFLGFGFDQTNIGPKVLNLNSVVKAAEEDGYPYHYPIIKYSNDKKSPLIDRTVQQAFEQSPEGGAAHKSIYVSYKTAFGAVSEDFTLHSKY